MVQFSVPEIREIQAELNSWKYVILEYELKIETFLNVTWQWHAWQTGEREENQRGKPTEKSKQSGAEDFSSSVVSFVSTWFHVGLAGVILQINMCLPVRMKKNRGIGLQVRWT